jgi:hypothetical protein
MISKSCNTFTCPVIRTRAKREETPAFGNRTRKSHCALQLQGSQCSTPHWSTVDSAATAAPSIVNPQCGNIHLDQQPPSCDLMGKVLFECFDNVCMHVNALGVDNPDHNRRERDHCGHMWEIQCGVTSPCCARFAAHRWRVPLGAPLS